LNKPQLTVGKIFFVNAKPYAMIIALVVIGIFFQIMTDGIFFSVRNIFNISRQLVVYGILVIGMTNIIISGHIDLSIGSAVAVTGAIVAVAQKQWFLDPVIGILLALVVGLLLGMGQGYLIAYKKIPAFIVTLGGMLMFRGLTLVITERRTVVVTNKSFLFISQGVLPETLSYVIGIIAIGIYIYIDLSNRKEKIKYRFEVGSFWKYILKYTLIIIFIGTLLFYMNNYEGISVAVMILLVLLILFSLILKSTKFGQHVYAVGDNTEASQFSGINVSKVIMGVFIIMGLLAAISGVILVARLGAATNDLGNMFELDAIAACVIGGISFNGGKGRVTAALLGALVMTFLNNGMSLMNTEPSYQYIIKALILISAVWFDLTFNKK